MTTKRTCCEIGCGKPAEFEVWPRGRPNGLNAYHILPERFPGDVYAGYAWYEAFTDACAEHVEDAKSGCNEAVVIHLSRVTSVFSYAELFPKVAPGDPIKQ